MNGSLSRAAGGGLSGPAMTTQNGRHTIGAAWCRSSDSRNRGWLSSGGIPSKSFLVMVPITTRGHLVGAPWDAGGLPERLLRPGCQEVHFVFLAGSDSRRVGRQ